MDEKQPDGKPSGLADKVLYGGRKLTAREARLLTTPGKEKGPEEEPPAGQA